MKIFLILKTFSKIGNNHDGKKLLTVVFYTRFLLFYTSRKIGNPVIIGNLSTKKKLLITNLEMPTSGAWFSWFNANECMIVLTKPTIMDMLAGATKNKFFWHISKRPHNLYEMQMWVMWEVRQKSEDFIQHD